MAFKRPKRCVKKRAGVRVFRTEGLHRPNGFYRNSQTRSEVNNGGHNQYFTNIENVGDLRKELSVPDSVF